MNKMKPEDLYESIYAEYHPASRDYLSRLWTKLRLYREEAALALLDGGETFLDLGCGDGRLVFLATQKYKQVFGIDVSALTVRRAQERFQGIAEGRIHLQVADLSEGIPFGNASFDAVSCVAALEHIANPEELLKEIHRVLRPRGELVVVAPNVAYLPRRLSALIGRPPKTSAKKDLLDGGTLHYFTSGSLTRLLRHVGFVVIRKSNAGTLWFLRNWWKSLLASSLVIKAIRTEYRSIS